MVTVSIVIFKPNKYQLEKTLKCVFESSLISEIIIIDNDEYENPKELILDNRFRYHKSSSNIGYGAGHNLGFQLIQTRTDYHLILNPDVQFASNELNKMISFLNKNEEFGHLMPKVIFPEGSEQKLCKNNPSLFNMIIRGFFRNYKKLKKRSDDNFYYPIDYSKQYTRNIPYLSGCFMLFRRTVFEEIQGFDRRYFLHFEDADITREVLKISHNVFFNDAVITHHYGGYTHKSFKQKLITINSGLKYFIKWNILSKNING